jgi:hypothetical protein
MSQLRTNSIVPVGGIPAGASGGGIIQVVSVESTLNGTTNSTSFIDFPGLTATITPRSTSSKILVDACMVVVHIDSYTAFVRLVRGSSKIFPNGTGTESYGFSLRTPGANYDGPVTTLTYLDSPATTSPTTYKVQILSTNSGGSVTHYNRTVNIDTAGNGVTNYSGGYMSSTITLYEVSG